MVLSKNLKNTMTKKEYFLVNLIEELAELIKASSKVLRFSPNHKYEKYEKTNLENFEEEILDVLSLIALVSENHNLNILTEDIEEATKKKLKMFQRAIEIGTITDVDN